MLYLSTIQKLQVKMSNGRAESADGREKLNSSVSLFFQINFKEQNDCHFDVRDMEKVQYCNGLKWAKYCRHAVAEILD